MIVAHPDDEALWSGGTILGHPEWQWFVVSLCRKSDKERDARFYEALSRLNSEDTMGDLDDGPDQPPHAVHFESPQEKEWYYRWFGPDIVVGVGYWGIPASGSSPPKIWRPISTVVSRRWVYSELSGST